VASGAAQELGRGCAATLTRADAGTMTGPNRRLGASRTTAGELRKSQRRTIAARVWPGGMLTGSLGRLPSWAEV
jgi:hypothetical protein